MNPLAAPNEATRIAYGGLCQGDEKVTVAIHNICTLLNTSWAASGRMVHVCKGILCSCRAICGQRSILAVLLKSIHVVLYRLPKIPSLTRWTSPRAALGYFSLWFVLHDIGPHSFTSAFKNPNTEHIPVELDDAINDEWKVVMGKRLTRTFNFMTDPSAKLLCISGVVVNTPIQRALHFILRCDSKRDPSLSAWGRRQGVNLTDEGPVRAPDEPVAFALYRGGEVAECLREAARVLLPDPVAPDEVRSLRQICAPPGGALGLKGGGDVSQSWGRLRQNLFLE